MSSELETPKDLILDKWRAWPITHLDHWLAVRQMKRADYLTVLEDRGFSPQAAKARADAIREHPELYSYGKEP